MNKSALRSFSAWARRYLISNICDRAQFIGVTKDNVVPMQAKSADSFMVNGVTFEFAPTSRDHFVDYVKEVGWENAIEEIAYTWFNRILAIRFMEVNGYLENGVNGDNIYVIGSVDPDRTFPDAVDRATELKYVDKDKVYKYQDAEDNAGLFRYILMSQCAELSKWMPDVFEKVSDYTDLLLPETLLFPDGLIEHLTHDLNAADFDISAEGNGQVEIFGWMYQFYIAEKKKSVEESDEKVNKGTLPAKTQLFTPDWIVRYLVENSLGKMWVLSHGCNQLVGEMDYYDPIDYESLNDRALEEEIKSEYENINVRELKIIDPCCGSGHILVYAFDLLYQIYLKEGYAPDMIPDLILQNNLYGIDIDKRAIQLTSFALTMKARSYDKNLFKKEYHFPIVLDVHESNRITRGEFETMCKLLKLSDKEKEVLEECIRKYKDGEYYGSLVNSFNYQTDDYSKLGEKIEIESKNVAFDNIFDSNTYLRCIDLINRLIKQAEIMSDKYDCVITNPPYLEPSDCGDELRDYANTIFPNSKFNLYSMFIERCLDYVKENGIQAMITMNGWITMGSYEKFRECLLNKSTMIGMIDLGAHAFEDIGGEVVKTAGFVIRKGNRPNFEGSFYRLVEPGTQQGKEEMYLRKENHHYASQAMFLKMPGRPYAYWLSEKAQRAFAGKLLGTYADTKQGLATGCNDLFLRYWFEPSVDKVGFGKKNREEAQASGLKWFPCNKGGSYRKWYGNNDYVVDWYEDGKVIRNFRNKDTGKLRSRPQNMDRYFSEGLTWSAIANELSMRYSPAGFISETKGSMCFVKDRDNLWYILAVLNSKVVDVFLSVLSSNLDYHEGPMARVPMVIDSESKTTVDTLCKRCVELARKDWDSFEYSWDFTRHPLACSRGKIEAIFNLYACETQKDFDELKNCEEKLNEILEDLYGLNGEVDCSVSDSKVSVRVAEAGREIKSLISYAVGCVMGRYSLKETGLVYAGGVWNDARYSEGFMPCEFGVLPITEDQFFEEDLCTRVIDFIKVVYGEENLNDNLKYIASVLKPDSYEAPKSIIRDYLFNDFFNDHYQIYQHRPIYWQLDSGKAGGFRALVYMHRFTENTLPLVRTEFIQDLRYKYEEEMQRQKNRLEGASSTAESNAIKKDIAVLDKKIVECAAYDELLNHATSSIQNYLFDLDDGVKTNYAKFLSIDGDKNSNILTVVKL